MQGVFHNLYDMSKKGKVAVLQSVLHQAVKLGLIQTNPANAERLTTPKVITPKVEIFTKQEAIEMLSCLEDEHNRISRLNP